LRLFSPAKINLFLNVLRKRADGYHEIETLFERISLGDEIRLELTRSGTALKSSARGVPSGPQNLAFKAAELLREETGCRKGVRIHLKKRIPVAAGLGGGSSNAAAVLLGLNKLWRLRLSRPALLKLAARLGSDVPFFVLDVPRALGRGRGEKLAAMGRPTEPNWYCVVKPPFGISTKLAYAGLSRISLTPQKADAKLLLRSLQKGDPKSLSKLLTNSLELALNKRVRAISEIKKKLVSEGAFTALLSGSGSSVFGVFGSAKEAKRAAKNLGKKNKRWRVFAACTY
jgi:4-diphosphocytidyl-2-C-methyl-D-erythritol kinase